MANDHLTWNEIREFGGLYDRSDQILAPPNSATVMNGCHPAPGGGLRPFFDVTETRSSTGITGGVNPLGFAPTYGTPNFDIEFALITAENIAGMNWDGFGWSTVDDQWLAAGQSDGTGLEFAGDDSGAQEEHRQPHFVTHQSGLVPSSLDRHVFVSLPIDGAWDGIWEMLAIVGGPSLGDPAFDRHEDWDTNSPYAEVGPMAHHQGRLVVTQEGAVLFSEPGAVNALDVLQDTRFILPDTTGRGDSRIAWMMAIPPSDLMVCTVSGLLFNIQGNLDDPSVRELGRWGPSVQQQVTLTPRGVACIYPNDGVYIVTPDGGRELISASLDSHIWTNNAMSSFGGGDRQGFGCLAYSNGYLFLPNRYTGGGGDPWAGDKDNGALVYDMATGAWFTSTHQDDYLIFRPKWAQADHNGPDPGVWLMPNGIVNPFLHRIVCGPQSGVLRSHRNETWEWQTQELRAADGRQIEIREVQLHLSSRISSAVTVTVTTPQGSQVQSITTAATDLSVHRLNFNVRGDFALIRVKASSEFAGQDAPTLELIRWGSRQGHLIRGS